MRRPTSHRDASPDAFAQSNHSLASPVIALLARGCPHIPPSLLSFALCGSFAPLTGLEVASVPRVEGGVLVVELRLSCNLHDLTMERVIGKMQAGHTSMVESMLTDLKLAGAASTALRPLEKVLSDSAQRGYAFFNVPNLFMQATQEALAANTAALDALANGTAWAATLTEGRTAVAARMRGAAKLCAQHDRHEVAAKLLVLAVAQSPVSAEDAAAVERAWQGDPDRREDASERRTVLQALWLLLRSGECRQPPWPLTTIALAKASGDSHVPVVLAQMCGQHANVTRSRSFDEDATPTAVKGSALLAAAAAGESEAVLAALEVGADAGACAEHGVTPLMLAARAASAEAAAALLARRADANARSRKGSTALELAAAAGARECARVLLDAGAEPDVLNAEGLTPLAEAAQNGNEAVVRELLARRADVNLAQMASSHEVVDGQYSPLQVAAMNGHVQCVRTLLEGGAQINCNNARGQTPLMCAAIYHRQEVVAVLLVQRADANLTRHPFGHTALLHAAQNGNVAIVQALLAGGAQVGKFRNDGATPLFIAAAYGHASVAEMLVAHGAENKPPPLEIVPEGGLTPLEVAEMSGYDAVATALRRLFPSII